MIGVQASYPVGVPKSEPTGGMSTASVPNNVVGTQRHTSRHEAWTCQMNTHLDFFSHT